MDCPFASNCATTLAGIFLEVLDSGRMTARQKRLRWVFMTANSPATLWPRVKSTMKRRRVS